MGKLGKNGHIVKFITTEKARLQTESSLPKFWAMQLYPSWPPLLLNLLVLPGLGHWIIGQRWRGGCFIMLSLLLLLGGLSRFLSVFFAVANRMPTGRSPHLNPLPILKQTWQLDGPVLLTFIVLLIFVWLLGVFDLWRELRKNKVASGSL